MSAGSSHGLTPHEPLVAKGLGAEVPGMDGPGPTDPKENKVTCPDVAGGRSFGSQLPCLTFTAPMRTQESTGNMDCLQKIRKEMLLAR